jgi:uncharacterized protein (TIGR00255 family)
MILSMTGFSSQMLTLAVDENTKVNLLISIKSLNSRYFETTCKLPYALSHIETDIIKTFKKKLIRGHIYVTIYLGAQELLKGSVEPSITTIKGYLKAVEDIKKKFSIDGSLSLDTLIQMPHVFLMEEREIDSGITEKIFQALNSCTDALIKTKQEEGAALKKDLVLRISNMEKEIKIIAIAAEKLIEEQKIKVNAALKEIEADESKIAEARKNALYAILDKIDINEEIVRFKSHLKSISEQLDSAEPEKGKRLDFTLQEMGREINTVAAKCSDSTISAHAINIKVELEKAREQTQNIV